jgi:O-antigen ligase
MQASNDVRIHPRSSEAPLEAAWWRHPQTEPPRRLPKAPTDDREGRPAFVAVVIFTFILLLAPQNWFPMLAPFRIAFLAAGAAITALLWARWKQRRSPLLLTPATFISFILLLWAILTLPSSYSPGGSVGILTDKYIKALMIFWLLANIATDMRRLRFLTTFLMLCTFPVAVTAVKNFATGTFTIPGATYSQRIIGYESGIATNPNDLALLLDVLLPFGIALLLSTKKYSLRFLILIILGLDVLGVVLTFSRAGFLGLAAIGILYFAKLIRRPKPDRGWALGLLMLAIVSLPFLPASYVERLSTISDVQADPTGSSQERWGLNVAATQFIKEHPIFGAGIGMDILAINDSPPVTDSPIPLCPCHVHNVYLEYATDLGLPGALLFLLLFYAVFSAVNSSRRRLAGKPAFRELFCIGEGIEVSLLVFAICGFFLPVAYEFDFYFIAGLALGMAAATKAAISANEVVGHPSRESVAVHNQTAVFQFLMNKVT